MQAYKLKGTIDSTGNLILAEPLHLPPGDVEVIVLQEVENAGEASHPRPAPAGEQPETQNFPCRTKIFRDWLAKAKPVSPDFDPDQARWEALKEKYL
ncbi:MAG: hypothetical protein KME26_24185 [Oscillatoria princeps RMCB-10]|jgi:hypothetical protein|nr:hypothetical protein [Oscillatoria princeps RMCB-10]